MIKIDVRHLTPRPAFVFNSGQSGSNAQETHKGNGQLQRKCQNHTDSHFNDMELKNESSRINPAFYAQPRWREMDDIDAKVDQGDQRARSCGKSTKAPPPEHPARNLRRLDGAQNNGSGAFTFGDQHDSRATNKNQHPTAKHVLAGSHNDERSTPQKKIHGSFVAALNPLAPRNYDEAQLSMADTNWTRWRRKTVPVWLIEKGAHAPGLVRLVCCAL